MSVEEVFDAAWGLVSKSVLVQWFSNFSLHQNHLEGLLKHRLLGVVPGFLLFSSDWELGWG